MTASGWIATLVVSAVFVFLALGRHPLYLILLGGLAAILLAGIIRPAEVLSGFSNPGIVTVAVLFVVAAGLRQTGALVSLVLRALGRPRSAAHAQMRLVPPVVAGSALLNNTPVVAVLMPVVIDWCKAMRIPASKLLLPLSYLAILGGICTLIGTSTNIVVNGLLIAEGEESLGFFEIAWVGVPCAVLGILFLLLTARRFLPDRSDRLEVPDVPREYTVEMTVAPSGPLVGKSIDDAGIRHLPGVTLVEIHRRDHILSPLSVKPLEPADRLVFAALVDSVVDLQKVPGLVPATRQVNELDSHRAERCFAEAVVSANGPLVGNTIRESRFRDHYDAVVVAVCRDGGRIDERLGDIELRAGDTLLLETLPAFVYQHRNTRDFYLVSRLDGAGPPTTAQARVALLILVAMVLLAATGILSMLQAALGAAAAMLLTRCCSEETARKSVDWPLLVAIGASFGLGRALKGTGAADTIAFLLLEQTGNHPWLALIVIYGTTTMLSEFVTNNAAAIIVFPMAMSTAAQLDVNYMPFVAAVMIAGSASFATPIGYQTNLMVYGPGGYRFSDFLKMGLPMNLLMWIVTCSLAPLVWPF